MNTLKNYLIVLAGIFVLSGHSVIFSQDLRDETIFKALEDELQRNKNELTLADFGQPFFLSYALGESMNFDLVASLGTMINSYVQPRSAVASVRLLLGDYHESSDTRFIGQFVKTAMPVDGNYDISRRNLWLATDIAYKDALQNYMGKQAFLESNPEEPEEERLDDLGKAEPLGKLVENEAGYVLNRRDWEDHLRELSAVFKKYPDLFNSSVSLIGMRMEVYKRTSEGTKVKLPVSYVNLYVQASTTTDDGVRMTDDYSVVAATPQELPDMETLKEQLIQFAGNLNKWRNAEPVTEYYSGPVLFEEQACAQIFIDNLLNRNGLFAYRKSLGDKTERTLGGRIGQKVVDSRITVKNYSTLEQYNHTALAGAYEVDAEGMMPAEELTLIENGMLKNLLNGRVPALNSPHSTGSSRFILTDDDVMFVTAPGTIHVQVNNGTRPEKMKQALLKAAKEEGLNYAYIVRKIAGPASQLYKVDVKDGKETLMHYGELSAIRLSGLKRLPAISARESVMNYILNQRTLSSLIYPSSLLIGDVEIDKMELKKTKNPPLAYPLSGR